MDSRKIQLVGNRSYSVSLPKEWIINNKLKNQDSVFIEQTGDGSLLIKKSNIKPGEKKEITVSLEEQKYIKDFLIFCYVNNLERIRLIKKKSDYEKVNTVKNTLNCLEGYEITHEDDKVIEISFLFQDVNVNLNHIVRRMIYLLKSLTAQLLSKDIETMIDTEKDIGKMFNLSKRILFACTIYPKLSEENHIKNRDDLFFIKDVTKKIERIGNMVYHMKDIGITQAEFDLINNMIKILENILEKKDIDIVKGQLESLKVVTKTKELQGGLYQIHEICMDAVRNFMSMQLKKMYFSDILN